jgi:hypothetical protein
MYMVLANPTRDSRLKLATTIYLYGVYTVFLAGKSLNIRSCTPYVYGAGQPYTRLTLEVGQNHIYRYTVYIKVFLAGESLNYGHAHRMYMVLANPTRDSHYTG